MFLFGTGSNSPFGFYKTKLVTGRLLNVSASAVNSQTYRFSHRYHLSNFLDVQTSSFQTFLKDGLIHELKQPKIRVPFKGKKMNGPGLKLIFYPESYKLMKPKLTVKQAIYARKSYSSDLYVPIKIVDERTQSFILDWFCLATIPLMTSNGHFIVNGLPRMVMSQIVRCPGVYFKKLFRSENPNSGYYVADFIAHRGTWLRLETDLKPGKIWVKMKNEAPISFLNFFKYVGIASPILSRYYNFVFNIRFEEPEKGSNPSARAYLNDAGYTEDAFTVLLQDNLRRRYVRHMAPDEEGVSEVVEDPFGFIEDREDMGSFVTCPAFQKKQAERFVQTVSTGLSKPIAVLNPGLDPIPLMTNTLDWDTKLEYELEQKYNMDEEFNPLSGSYNTLIETLFKELEVEQKLIMRNIFRPGFSQKDMESHVKRFFTSKFFSKRTYNLSLMGRAKLNKTFGLSIPLNVTFLTEYDLLFGALYLIQCATGKKPLSDIDHLMNRKIKPVGELIQNQFAVGLQRFEEVFIDQLCNSGSKKKKTFFSLWQAFSQQISKESLVTELNERLSNFITPKPLNTALKDFFGSNPLSQMLDQTNPLAEITHKRRLSSLGIGGVSRQNAGMDIRGIHPTHYGRICPIETPEGQNAGLVNSFTIYSKLDSFGFLQTPFYELYRGFVVREKGPLFFLANQEKGHRIAPGDLAANDFDFLPHGILLPSRKTKLFERVDRSDLEYIGVHPLQMISIATSLIPFLEHDDGNRALMGSNMQRQSVPTLHPTKPIVGTGLESKVILDVDHVLQAKESGLVSYVDSRKICLYSSVALKQGEHKPQAKTKKNAAGLMKKSFDAYLKRKSGGKNLNNTSQNVPLFFSKPRFLKKPSSFNSLCTTNTKSFLSFLSLTQFQHLYQSLFQTDKLGMMQIFELMENQKTYDQKQKKLIKYKNPFLLALKNQPTLDSPQVFLNAAFFALEATGNSIPFSFNSCVSCLKKKTNVSVLSAQENSPFANRVGQSQKKKLNQLLLNATKVGQKKTVQSFLRRELECLFDPHQTSWDETPGFFLRVDSPLIRRPFVDVTRHSVSAPLIPRALFNSTEVTAIQRTISGKWKKKTTQFKPFFYPSGLIQKVSKAVVESNFNQNPSSPSLKFLHHDQILLKKQLFYQNVMTKVPTPLIETSKPDYFPLRTSQTVSFKPSSSNDLKGDVALTPDKSDLQYVSYSLDTIARSNQDTYLLHRPAVRCGQWVEKGDVLADNASSCKGELAIGKNLLVGYTPWEGYNFEDAVLLSERVVNQELFSSLHVERYEVDVRDTPDGIEEILRYPPTSNKTQHLDSNGIVKVGSWVTTGDILVGKQTPKPPQDDSGFEALLTKIFEPGEAPKSETQYRDTSLRVPPDVHGWVVHTEIVETMDDFKFAENLKQTRKMIKKQIALDKKNQKRAQKKKNKKQSKQNKHKRIKKITKKQTNAQTIGTYGQQKKYNPYDPKKRYRAGRGFNFSLFKGKHQNYSQQLFSSSIVSTFDTNSVFRQFGYSTACLSDLKMFSLNTPLTLSQQILNRIRAFNPNSFMTNNVASQQERSRQGRLISKQTVDFFADDLDHPLLVNGHHYYSKEQLVFKNIVQQVPKRVNVYIAEKRHLQVGDKIAGRHGNKGIISNILPEQDMPYLPDGTPLDLVLNPLGVPSRMNVGQIFECLLGLAGSYLHQTYKIQPFDEQYGCEASRSLVYSKLYEARLKTQQNWLFDPNFPGKVRLFDGRTGQCFEQPVTVGKAYILKLIHLVDEKIHARSTGPYSLVTQQPLRGRSNRGGQRVGEMEVWALEGFGASYILQELLTLKSDDVVGRSSITKSVFENKRFNFGPPESFRTLLRELEALCLGASVYLK